MLANTAGVASSGSTILQILQHSCPAANVTYLMVTLMKSESEYEYHVCARCFQQIVSKLVLVYCIIMSITLYKVLVMIMTPFQLIKAANQFWMILSYTIMVGETR